jgi:hypothetical protein
MVVADLVVAPAPLVAAPEAYWNGPPPPYAYSPPPVSFWSRPRTWIITALIMLALTIGYFLLSAAGSFASAPGGCGGG